MNHLYIIRGISGAGKSTFAQTMLRKGMISFAHEADAYMLNEAGQYQYDKEKLFEAHKTCLECVKRDLFLGDVAVSNTFTRIWEMQPYFDIGCAFTVIRCEGRFKNVHGTPEESIARMVGRFENWPGDRRK